MRYLKCIELRSHTTLYGGGVFLFCFIISIYYSYVVFDTKATFMQCVAPNALLVWEF